MFIHIGLQRTIEWWVELTLFQTNDDGIDEVTTDTFARIKDGLAIAHLHIFSENGFKSFLLQIVDISRNNHLSNFLTIGADVLNWRGTSGTWDTSHRFNTGIAKSSSEIN